MSSFSISPYTAVPCPAISRYATLRTYFKVTRLNSEFINLDTLNIFFYFGYLTYSTSDKTILENDYGF
jgi:hypothetical protein